MYLAMNHSCLHMKLIIMKNSKEHTI
jgi:hypothetical protein